ncbi:MAG: hypothetical protein Q4G24_04080 [Paracoccus sp. (in: a-proteobacteria)]|uniref:hypothetical protein n=1 Tax=Paracoccus sp. TaxID=267 RepID=UPI0026E0C199|nr:hypothetical protein [Paracoccus sp. (in: a-proteobacteria)]MDO5620629.1 hypothetical protein [Paracoccus sp. (in: a-proteobacteria)]
MAKRTTSKTTETAQPAAKRATATKAPAAKTAPKAPAKATASRPRKAPAAQPASKPAQPFNILIVAHQGRLAYEALIFTASLRANAPDFKGRLIVAEPRAEGRWSGHEVAIPDPIRKQLESMGAEITPFTAHHFGAEYPNGNKIEALAALPSGQPFIFFDTDTIITGPLDQVPFDFDRPSASMKREGTWPEAPLYGPTITDIWKSLYDRFGLDFDSSLDKTQPDEHWERYLYFNAGWFFGADPEAFGKRYSEWAQAVRNHPGEVLAAQNLYPWLDQIVLPLVIHSFGGGRPGPELAGLDGDVTLHYRMLPLFYALAPQKALDTLEALAEDKSIRRLLRDWEPAKKLILQGKGLKKLRPLFEGQPLPRREMPIRQKIKANKLWLV